MKRSAPFYVVFMGCWAAVERLSRYGGIRIEDDVACRAGGEAPENLTRDAFAGVGA